MSLPANRELLWAERRAIGAVMCIILDNPSAVELRLEYGDELVVSETFESRDAALRRAQQYRGLLREDRPQAPGGLR